LELLIEQLALQNFFHWFK